MKESLKNLVAGKDKGNEPAPETPIARQARQAKTRTGTRSVAGHFKPEVAQALRMLAAEQDMENQELLAEALNMLFERYGKPTRVKITAGRRRRDV